MTTQDNKSTKPKKKKSFLSAEVTLFSKVSDLAIALSIRHLSLMLKSGLSLGDAVKILSEQTSDKKLKEAFGEIYERIQDGMNLSDSMAQNRKVFSEIIISIISIGEQGGTLEQNLNFLADYLKKAHELNRKVKGALIYPAIVFFLTIAEMVGVIFLILPKLQELFSTFDEIPPMTQLILNISSFIRNNVFAILISIGFIIFLINLFLRTDTGKDFKDSLKLKLPVIKKLDQNNVLATFSRTVNILLVSGIPLVKAIEISSNTTGNRIYNKVLANIFKQVDKGMSLAEALSQYPKFFPPTFTKMLEIGEATGSLENNLFYLYDYHAGEVQDMSNNLTTLLEPILLIFVGVMIGVLALIIIGPIYQFTGSING